MKKTIHIISIVLLSLIAGHGQTLAQSPAVQKAAKSVVTLTTFKADGSILSTTHGAYCGEKGEVIAAFTPFVGASSAIIMDAAGKKYDVDAILGADDMYDVCRFRVNNNASTPLPTATSAVTSKAWTLGYSTKKATINGVTLKGSEKFLDKYTYYTFNEEVDEENDGCPVVDDNGMLVGLVQRIKTNYDIHVTDAAYYLQLTTNGLSLASSVMQKTNIRPALPTDHEQARLMLIMLNNNMLPATTQGIINEYISRFPEDNDGYVTKAKFAIDNATNRDYSEAASILEGAMKKVASKDELLAEYSRLIYTTAVYSNDSIPASWTLNDAETQINNALAISNQPAYRHQLAQITYAKGDYAKAYDIFSEVSKTDISSSEIFYECAQCKLQMQADNQEVLALLDSAVNKAPQPLTQVSAPYLLARGMARFNAGELRPALQDYNMYDTLMLFRASDDFYYTRYQCEMKLRQYQPALNDIAHACVINQQEPTYLAELASLQLRVGHFEEALQACDICLMLTEEYPDIYIIKGMALIRLERKDEALQAFQKAKDLGDERGDEYLTKYAN